MASLQYIHIYYLLQFLRWYFFNFIDILQVPTLEQFTLIYTRDTYLGNK